LDQKIANVKARYLWRCNVGFYKATIKITSSKIDPAMSWALGQTTWIFEELVIFGVQLFGGWKVKKLDSQPTSYASSLMILVVWNPRGSP
jgi:hypothetical protein